MKGVKDFFLGPDGDASSKRLFLLLLILVAVMYFIVNLYWGLTMKASLEDYLFWTIWGFFFGVAAERWKKKPDQLPTDKNTTP